MQHPDVRATKNQRTRWNTQDAAWEEIQPALSGIKATVFEAIKAQPTTCDALELRLGLSHQTCSAAINNLMNDGRIESIGTAKTRSGRSARVWSAVVQSTLFPMGAA